MEVEFYLLIKVDR